MAEKKEENLLCQINVLSDCVLERIFTSINLYENFNNIRLVNRHWNRVGTLALMRMKRQFYRCNNFSWLLVDEDLAHSNLLSERCSHSACYHPKEKVMFMFGGCTSTYTAFNDLWLFDLSIREWERIIISRPPLPSAKALASLVLYKDNLILYGGFSKSSMNPIHQTTTFYKEIHLFNRSKNCWEEIICENTAPHLAGHTATIVGDFMLVFGGSMGSSYNNNVYVLDITRRIWNMPSIPGPCPPPRYGQSQILLDHNHLVIIGGCGGPSVMFNDVWLLDFDLNGDIEWKWTQLKVENIELTPPYMWCHRACKVGKNALVLSRPTKYDITKQSRRRRTSTQSNNSGSGSAAHLPYRISSPDSPQDRRAVAAAFCNETAVAETSNYSVSGLVTSTGDVIVSKGSYWGRGNLAAKRKPILLSSKSLDEQDQKVGNTKISTTQSTSSKTTISLSKGQTLNPQSNYKTSLELHRACSIPAIIVGEIPKLIVTSSNDTTKISPAMQGSALIVVNESQSFDSSISSSTFANSNINQAFKIINDVSTKSSVVFGIDSENDEFDVAKDSLNSNTTSMHGDAVRDYYMSLLKEEYNRQKIVELDENLSKIDQKLNLFLSDRVPYLTAQERLEMIEELLKRKINEISDDENESTPSTSFRNCRKNIGKLNNSVRSQRTSLDSSNNSSRRHSVQSSAGNNASVVEVNAQFGQIYYRHMCVYVLRLVDALSQHKVKWEQLPVEEDAPEDIILYSIVAGQGELILFGGMRSDDGNGMDCLNVGMDRHAMSSDTYIIRPRYTDL